MDEQLDIAAIKARVEAATPGEWFFDSQTVCTGEIYDGDTLVETITIDYADRHGNVYFKEAADAEFVAHARQDVPLLIAEVERLRAALDAEKASVEWASREAGMMRERAALDAEKASVEWASREVGMMRERLEEENEQLRAFEKQVVYTIEENRKLREKLTLYDGLVLRALYLECESKVLRETLQFYADEANYQNISFSEPYSKVSSDYGTKARAALGNE